MIFSSHNVVSSDLLQKISKVAYAHGAFVVNTLIYHASDVSLLVHGFVDIVMHSATKFISSHSDFMAGVLVFRGERFFPLFRIRFII
ncbi:hypothetical protein MTR67_039081 [Solanum verrucosum]|uniref:Cystathionine beta-lyase n=1 Tax=Solanum verrucosum TaxID=315347 RepID=A0AAF0UHE6_SOLVR|nr:hypothetical protein MTR67_039081 [Solanum verrucosum]